MRPSEAAWIGGYLAAQSAAAIDPVVELGSSTERHRRIVQPHIHANIHGKLAARGVRIVTCDMRQGEGIDICGDIADPAVQRRIAACGGKMLLCCNILEHVADREGFARLCASLIGAGGRILVSVPCDYPYHPDPLDTGFRPDVAEIAALFSDFDLVEGARCTDITYAQDMVLRHGRLKGVLLIVNDVLKSLYFDGGWWRTLGRLHRFKWLFHPYGYTIAVLQKRATNLP